ncbi:MAG: F0F1 ATP synthase subunit alpha, partial [Ignavibacteriaceae bacterium]
IFLGTNGYMDNVPVHEIKHYEKEALAYIEVKHNEIFEKIKKEKQLSDETISEIKKAAEEFSAIFKVNS